MRATLIRTEHSDDGTFGVLALQGSPEILYTAEPPWRDNEVNCSCIPCGEYLCERALSPSRGWVYWVREVPGRSHIQLHVGNLAGDMAQGLKSDTEGCLLPGLTLGQLRNQRAVLDSLNALDYLCDYLQRQPFTLEILGCVGHDHIDLTTME